MANPRIDELRKKLEKEPGSRLFAQLAEELRKDGDLEDAIRVAREGLQKHSNYPSARMTLGRALYDTGDWAAARVEFEQVLKGAADNILASRLLAECLENLGDVEGAVARYKKTLALAPGDKQVLARLDVLQKGGAAGAAVTPPPDAGSARGAAPAGAPPSVSSPPPPAPEPAPIRVVAVDTPMELETTHAQTPAAAPPPPSAAPATAAAGEVAGAAPAADAEPAPIPLAAADEHFELERANEPPAPSVAAPAHASTPSPARAAVPSPAPGEGMMEFEFDSVAAGGTIPFAPPPAPLAPPPAESPAAPPQVVPAPAPAPAPAEEPPMARAAAPPAVAPAEVDTTAETLRSFKVEGPRTSSAAPTQAASPDATAADLMSPTLAELYFNQGFLDKAIEVYRQLLEREPGNDRLERRLVELQALTVPSDAPAEAPPAATPAASPAPPPPSPGPGASPAPVSVPAVAAAGPDGAAAPPSDAATRRLVLERTIARLEGMLAAIKKG